ncbi:MAG TPA: arginine--tRNA ligase [Verrucomicrobia bacterium]|nr:arginine--tRNA ligase [Verrucomicrobiota bacterium]
MQIKTETLTTVLTAWMQSAFSACYGESTDVSGIGVVATANPAFGDYQCNAAMGLAKLFKTSPRTVADAVVVAAPPHPAVARLEVAGPGFINIFLDNAWVIEQTAVLAADACHGVPQIGHGQTVVMDYSSPNIAKPMHIGHIRSTIIGNSIDRMHRLMGFRVIADNHIGDWGTQFGIIIMGYRHFLDRAALEQSPIEELERVYVKSYEKAKADDSWMTQCRQELVKLQTGDPENTALWKQFIALSLGEFERIYKRLDVCFDLVRGESFYNDRLASMVALLQSHGLVRESEGAQCVFLEDDGLPVCIVRKSDGGYNYATSDLATVQSRVEEFSPLKIVYITDERQQLHFKQFFCISRKLGVTTRLDHVWFGLMRLPDATFSTRQGNVIKLEHLLDEAERRALDLITSSSPDMPEDRRRDVARAVGIGAVKYADLSQNPQTTVTFTWDKALALDGNSGPYLQYAYARMASVRDKYRERFPEGDLEVSRLLITEPIERELMLKLLRFPEVVVRAAEAYKPSMVADYLYDLSQTYISFYQNVPFLKAESGIRESRVLLCDAIARILRQGLGLLGIETPERI